LAASTSGGLVEASDTYMDKLCVGKEAAGVVDIRKTLKKISRTWLKHCIETIPLN